MSCLFKQFAVLHVLYIHMANWIGGIISQLHNHMPSIFNLSKRRLQTDNDYVRQCCTFVNIIRSNVRIIFAYYAAVRPYNMQILYGRSAVIYATRSQAVTRIAVRTAQCLTAHSGVTWRHRSRDHLIAHIPFPIGGPLEPSLYYNGFRDIQRRMSRNGWHDLDTTSKWKSRSFILVPIDFSYTTSCRIRLSIVTFALGRTI